MQKRLVLVCEDSLFPRKQPDVSGPASGRRDVTEWYQSRLSRFHGHVRAYVRGHEHGRVGAQMPPACARARGRSVRGHLGCAFGTRCTDVAQAPLALDARMSHMGRWHWTYETWPREDVPDLRLTDEDVGLLRG